MNQDEERKMMRNERRRLAYRSLQPQAKLQLLERRRQQYKERINRSRNSAMAEKQTASPQLNLEPIISAGVDVNQPTTSLSMNLPLTVRASEHEGFSHSICFESISDVLLCDVDVVQGRSSRSTRIADRFSRISAVPSIIWEIPARPNCQFCSAKKFFHESAGFCCSNGEVALAPMVKNPLLYHLFTTDVTSIGVRFRRRVRTYNNNFALTSIDI